MNNLLLQSVSPYITQCYDCREMLSRIIFLSVLSTLCDGAYFNTRSLSANTQIALNNFLLDQYDFGVIKTEVGGNSYGFSRTGIIALQEFLQAKGRLPINSVFNSLVIGTLQTYLYDLNFYPDEKPCGVFGPDTRRGLQQFLQKQRFYRYTQHKITANSKYDYLIIYVCVTCVNNQCGRFRST